MKNMRYIIFFFHLCLVLNQSFGIPVSQTLNNEVKKPWKLERYADLGLDNSDDYIPRSLLEASVNATLSRDPSMNQYAPTRGQKRLLNAIASLYSPLIGVNLNPDKNVLITVGATEAVHCALLTFTSPGDEWIIFEPFWTKYIPMIKMARGIAKFATLKLTKTIGDINGNDYAYDKKELESLFSNKTRGIIFNNPNNPTGKMYSIDELKFIAHLAQKYNVLVISDEAHEWIVYEPYVQHRIASLPGMFNRTITIGSASKTFTVAGWRIGWAYGPSDLLNAMKDLHTNIVGSAPTAQQEAVAYGFENEFRNFGKPESFFISNRRNVTIKRDALVKAIKDAGMIPTRPNGGYCMIASFPTQQRDQIDLSDQVGADSGEQFSNWLTVNVGILGYPLTEFYSEKSQHLGMYRVRLCFQKRIGTLQRAANNLKGLQYYL